MTKSELLQTAKPILFNAKMVRAILDGRKTVTRRLIRDLPENTYRIERVDENLWEACYGVFDNGICLDLYEDIKPPYQIGQVLYVRETFGVHVELDKYGDPHLKYCYKADGIDIKADILPGLSAENNRWYPSIHMPKEAARIFLRVTDVRVERLQDMQEEDAYKEGYIGCQSEHTVYCESGLEACYNVKANCPHEYWYCNHSHQEGFGRDIWDSTVKKSELDRYGWNTNPYVWVVEFERAELDEE